jgi:hypothetical protein
MSSKQQLKKENNELKLRIIKLTQFSQQLFNELET